MKKYIISAVVAVLVLSSFAASPEKKEQTVVREAAELALNRAVSEGLITSSEEERFLRSGILEEATNTLIATHFDVAAAVDKAAERAVEEGYFKNKKQAKRTLRQAIEKVRKSESFWEKAYRMMGI